MEVKKFLQLFSSIFIVIFSFFLSGCYTQFSRPDVDTEYYPQEDEQYQSEYYSDNNQNDSNIDYYSYYFYEAPPFYYGPQVWSYWSPYYRWYNHRGYYDSWWYEYDYYWGYRIYDPFWDPWYDDWWYYNYYYYHPRHYYYWTYEDGHNSWKTKSKRKPDFGRRDIDYMKDRYTSKRKQDDYHKEIIDQVKKHIPGNNDINEKPISLPNRPLIKREIVDKNNSEQDNVKSPDIRIPKQEEPDLIVAPKDKNVINEPPPTKIESPPITRPRPISKPKDIQKSPNYSKPSRESTSIKKSPPPTKSKPSNVKPPSTGNRQSIKAPPPKRSPSNKPSGGSKSTSSKDSGKKKK